MKKLIPDLMVKDVAETVDFYTSILGFELDMAVPENAEIIEDKLNPDKNYVYAMVHCDEVCLMFMREDIYKKDVPALKDTVIGASASFYIEMENLENFYNKIKDKVTVEKELATTWYGMHEFYIRDINGYILVFAEQKT